VRRLTGALLLLFSLPAAALSVGREQVLAPQPRYAPSNGSQSAPALATDGTTYLAVWTEAVAGREGIYGAVMDQRAVVGPTPARVLVPGTFLGGLQVVWAGDAYQLTWYDGVRGAAMTARVSREGELVSEPVVIGGRLVRAMAYNGSRTLVVSIETGGVVTGTFLGRNGVERTPFVITVAPYTGAVSVVAVGTDFLVTWAQGDTAATPLRMSIRTLRLYQATPGPHVTLFENVSMPVNAISSASDGQRVGIAFTAGSYLSPSIRRFTVDADTLTFTEHQRVFTASMDRVVIRVPGGFAVGYLARESDKLTLNLAPFASSSPRSIPLGASHGSELGLITSDSSVAAAWRESDITGTRIVATVLDRAAAAPIAGIVPLAKVAVRQVRPMVAPAGEEALVVWLDQETAAGGTVLAARIGADGTALGEPVLIATNASDSQAWAVYTGAVWLVTWVSGDDTHYRRVARDGTLLDPTPVAAGPGWVSVGASNGDVTVMVLASPAGSRLVRFSRAGQLLGSPLRIDLPHAESIATNGREFLLAWSEGSNWWQWPDPDYRDIRALRLTAAGEPMDTVPLAVAVGPQDTGVPRVASDGKDFVVVYEEIDWTDRRTHVRAKRVLLSGSLDGTTATQHGTLVREDSTPLDVAPLGTGYVVLAASTDDARPRLILATETDSRGNPSGTLVKLVVSNAEHAGASIASSATHTWTAYGKPDPRPESGNVVRIFTRAVSSDDGQTRRRTVRR
jgi:large repetitive protein